MERAAAGTPRRRERGLVAPQEGVITAPGLIPAEVPGVTFPSSRAVVSVAAGGGGGPGGRREGGRGRRRRSRGPAHTPAARRAGGRREVRSPLRGGGQLPQPRLPPPGSPALSPSLTGSPPIHPRGLRPAVLTGLPRPRFPTPAPPPGARGRPLPRRPVNAASRQKSGRFKRAFETR